MLIVQKKSENSENNSKKKNNKVGLVIIILLLIIAVCGGIFIVPKLIKNSSSEEKEQQDQKEQIKHDNKYLEYRLSSNNLENFDLYFLQLENAAQNKVYSPLSIKYALNMLAEGADGDTKAQITDIVGDYKAVKYSNNKNMSFANALFIKDTYQNNIKDSYKTNLTNKYNAEVIYDSFTTPDALNSWISSKTFNLIKQMENDIADKDFILANALSIDMEWKNKIQSERETYEINYAHREYSKYVGPLVLSDYTALDFKGYDKKAKAAEIGAVINKYDIINTLGEDNIRKTVTAEYQKWLDNGAEGSCLGKEEEPDAKTYVDNYIKEISEGYKDISSSTDFSFYTDDNVKVFAKDLKQYGNTTLEYIGIMPTKENLEEYIKNIKASDVNNLISNLKTIELDNFKDGVITEIKGYIPMFNFDYELKLQEDLGKLGITDVFDSEKANLSNLTSDKAFISSASHKANIEFSNDGIKAGAATALGGAGAVGCGFDYIYDVPVEVIDLTFDNPYLFIIRDKDSGEVWFTGTVYEPVEFTPSGEI